MYSLGRIFEDSNTGYSFVGKYLVIRFPDLSDPRYWIRCSLFCHTFLDTAYICIQFVIRFFGGNDVPLRVSWSYMFLIWRTLFSVDTIFGYDVLITALLIGCMLYNVHYIQFERFLRI